jgi:hypothetical protein
LRCHSLHTNYVHEMQAVRHIAAGPVYQRRSRKLQTERADAGMFALAGEACLVVSPLRMRK